MKIKSLVLTTGITVSGIVASGAFAPAQAFTVFFGEDQGANTSAAPSSIPNSIIAANNFLSNLSGVGTETFESYAAGASPLLLNFPGVGLATLTSSTGTVASGVTSNSSFPISGTKSYAPGSGTFTISFAAPVAAFGFYGTDIGDFNGRITLALNNLTSTTLTVPNTLNGANGSALYYGFIAQNTNETFTSLTFGNTNAGTDVFGFDDLTVGSLSQVAPATSVPEPFTIIGTLIGGTAVVRMRKKLKSDTPV